MNEMTDAYVKLDKVSKIYGTKEVKIVAVDEPRRYLPDRQGVTGETGENSRQGANRVIARKYQRIPQT